MEEEQQYQDQTQETTEHQPDTPEHVSTTDQQQPQESSEERNFRELRQKKAQLERERDTYYKRLQEIEQQQQQQKEPPQPQEDDLENLNPDDLVEWRHVKKQLDKLRNEVNSYQQQTNMSAAETRLRSELPDVDSVVTQDNLAQLSQSYPEIAQTINSTQDFYTKAKSAYTLIKQLGIAQSQNDKQRVEENANKPRPLSSISPQDSDSPMSQANAFAQGLTPELKKQLLREMIEAKKKL